MNKEHHKFVADFFNKDGQTLIHRLTWLDEFLKIPTNQLVVEIYSTTIGISDPVSGLWLYGGISTKETAIQIIEYIKETEILFV